LTKGDTSAFGIMSRITPSVRFSALAIVNQNDVYGFLNMIIYLAVNVLGFIIFIVLGQLLYFKGIKGLNQGYSKKGFDTSKIYEQSAISKNIMLSYAIKEFRILFRTPMYFLNCVLISILLPVIMATSLTFSKSSARNGPLSSLTGSIDWASSAAIVFAVGFAMGVGISSLNSVAASALSRDGHDFLFFKYAPLKIETQLWGKLIPALVLGVLGTLIMIIAACFFITVPLWVIFLVIPSIILGTFLQAFIGLTIDVLMPKLTWVNEASAVKQNMNVLIAMALSIAIAAAVVIVNIKFLTEMSAWMKISIFSLLFIALDIAAYKLLIFIANKRIPEIII
jgi:ABC-2 type transport system permease protein